MNDLKKKIENIVSDYKTIFPKEYIAVIKLVSSKRSQQQGKFAETKGDHAIERGLYEIPETLDGLLNNNLTLEERKHYKTKPMARWFAKRFPEFRLGKRV